MNEILAAHFQTVRTRIEAEVKLHSIIMVTSAKADDGAKLTSFGLAECLASAGHQTALIDAAANPDSAVNGRFKTKARCGFPIYALPEGDGTQARARDALETFERQVREEFDYTIVDAPPFVHHNVTVALARTVDAVIVTLRLGREPSKADQFTIHALGRAGAHLLGVIAVTPESIEHFHEVGGAQYIADPLRRVTPHVANGTTGGGMQIRARRAR
jgi:Mrp family chromosome partitioning ATPase